MMRKTLVSSMVFMGLVLGGCSAAEPVEKMPAHTHAAAQSSAAAVQVPNVTLMTKRDAYAALRSRGLTPVVKNFDPSDVQLESRLVAAQSPAPWGMVKVGTTIELELVEPLATPTATPTPSITPAPAPDLVTYTVSGNGVGSATISYSIPDGSFSEQEAVGVALPWSRQFPLSGSFIVYTIVAQGGGGAGSISCEIDVNGHVLTTQTSTGAYAVVTCSH